MEKKLSKAILAKTEEVNEIQKKIQEAKSVIIVKYSGLTVLQDTELRNEFRKNNVEYKVLKNTLIKRAMNSLGYTEFDELLNGTTSVAFCKDDEVAAAKVVTTMSKKFANKLSAKAGLVDKKFVSDAEVAALAQIPSRDVLIAKIVGCLASPISKFVYTINAIKEAREQA